jgi:aminoglycoside 2'-N-acetyltransferase I
MVELVVAHTAQLEPGVLRAARGLLDGVFAGELSDDNWEHCLGGLHAVLWQWAEVVGDAALVQRRLLHGAARCAPATSRAWRCGPTCAAAGTAGC